MSKHEETWFLTATLHELEFIEKSLMLQPDTTARTCLLTKVRIALKEARNWETPLSEMPVTKTRGELPDA